MHLPNIFQPKLNYTKGTNISSILPGKIKWLGLKLEVWFEVSSLLTTPMHAYLEEKVTKV